MLISEFSKGYKIDKNIQTSYQSLTAYITKEIESVKLKNYIITKELDPCKQAQLDKEDDRHPLIFNNQVSSVIVGNRLNTKNGHDPNTTITSILHPGKKDPSSNSKQDEIDSTVKNSNVKGPISFSSRTKKPLSNNPDGRRGFKFSVFSFFYDDCYKCRCTIA